jgi:outer membrane lipoprotein-sorting protein
VKIARHRAAFLALTALVLSVAARASAQGLEALLPPAAPAAYRGRKVVIDFTRRGPQVTSMSVLCRPGGFERRELHATRSTLVIDGESVWQYLPERGIVLKRPSRNEGGDVLRPDQLRRALASYKVRVVPSEPVVGRLSRVVEFTPRQAGSRPRRLVWVDVETGLILRSEVYGSESRRLSWLSVFEELEYHPALDAASFTMQVPSGARVVESAAEPCLEPEAAERLAGFPVGLPVYLPEGFTRQCIKVKRQRDYREIQVVFGDGLSLLSLFESTSFHEPAAEPGAAPSVVVGRATGRWHDLGSVKGISWRAPWAYMALLGEISRSEMGKVAGSVRTRQELSAPFPHQ